MDPHSVRRSRIGVCSWSLQPVDADSLVASIMATGLSATQLALDPIRLGAMTVQATERRFSSAGITILSGMMGMEGEDYSTVESIRVTGGIVPDARWPANRRAAAENARIAAELEIGLVTFHAGFLPETVTDPGRAALVERLRIIAATFADRGIRVALETGQESAATLQSLLAELDGVGINFDPANMILYGTDDPVNALKELQPHVMQMHIKDAISSPDPNEWGTEVPVGSGDVDWSALFAVHRAAADPVALVIERESGSNRVGDVLKARNLIEHHRDAEDE